MRESKYARKKRLQLEREAAQEDSFVEDPEIDRGEALNGRDDTDPPRPKKAPPPIIRQPRKGLFGRPRRPS